MANTKLRIGTEVECLIVERESLRFITREASERMAHDLAKNRGWRVSRRGKEGGYIRNLRKTVAGRVIDIQYDTTFANFEFGSLKPVRDLATVRRIHDAVLRDISAAARTVQAMIWPMGVAPQASGLFGKGVPEKPRKVPHALWAEKREAGAWDGLFFIASQQVNIDVPLARMVAVMNDFYLNLGAMLEPLANSPVIKGNFRWIEGRYYFWNSLNRRSRLPKYRWIFPRFPKTPFANWQDYYARLWNGAYFYTYRRGEWMLKKDDASTVVEIIRRGWFETLEGKVVRRYALTVADIKNLFYFNWTDFKPHFRFRKFTVAEFRNAVISGTLDAFLAKYAKVAYLEVRCFPANFEDQAMAGADMVVEFLARHRGRTSASVTREEWQSARRRFVDAVVRKNSGRPVSETDLPKLNITAE